MDNSATFLFLFSLGAFFVPVFCRQIKIPGLVGEMLYGVLLNVLFYTEEINLDFIDYLAQMGFIFLMFLAGLELNFDNLNFKSIRLPVLFSVIHYLFAFFIWRMYMPEQDIFIILLLTASSIGIAFLGLKLEKAEKSKLGVSLIWIATVGELLSIFLLILFEVSHNYETIEIGLIRDISGFFLLLIVAYILIHLIMFFLWKYPKAVYALDTNFENDISRLFIRLAFLVMLTMVALTSLFKLELILGAFIGGMMFSFIFRDKTNFAGQLESIGYGFFIPFFFMKLGWDFAMDTGDLYGAFLGGIKFYAIILAIRFIASLLVLFRYRELDVLGSLRDSLSSAFLLAAPLTLLVALAKLGLSLNVIQQMEYNMAIIAAMVGGLLAPIGFSIFYSEKRG